MADAVDAPALVLVTGAAGYIASHVVAQLLEAGYAVRASVRDPSDAKKVAHLTSLPHAAERLSLVKLNLTDAAGWDDAVAGCAGVVHTAMQVLKPDAKEKIRDPHKHYVEPAIKGMNFVLEASRKSATVRRIIFTSSTTTISEGFPDWKTKTYSPSDWNTTATLKRNPYAYAKTMAEKRLFEFMGSEAENTTKMSFATVLPFAVLGPSLSNVAGDNDKATLLRLMNGGYPVLPPLTFGSVDVRDVAAMHVRALAVPAAHGQRFIGMCKMISAKELADLVIRAHPEYRKRLPSRVASKSLILMACNLGMFNKEVTQYFRDNIGRLPKFDTTNVQSVLGITFRDPAETVKDGCDYLLARGMVRKPLKSVKGKGGAGALAAAS